MLVKTWVARFLRRHLVLALFLFVSSIISAIVYEVTGGGKPKAWTYDAPRLNAVDLEGSDRPRALWTHDDFECIGWRATHNCDPYGPRDEARERKCGEPMPRTSGFCEVRNRTSGEILRVMLATCKSWQWYLVPKLSCNDARNFTDFSVHAAGYRHPPPELPPPQPGREQDEAADKRGIVMIAYPKKFTGGDGTAASLARDLDKYRVQCKMRRLGQYTCFMLNPRAPDGNGTPSLILSLENTKYLPIEQHAIGFSIEGRGLFNKEEEDEVAKIENDAQAMQDEEAAAIVKARERSEKQTRGIFGIVVVAALGLWLRWQWIRRCRKSRPKLETKNSSVAVAEETSPSHVALVVDPSSPETSGSSTAVFSGTSFNSRRRNSSFQLDDK
ncbi:hypothetical protein PC116_g13110 [Phytophthora cactorum]|uniref:Uncharacterized protein n=1 Tax=Phytophthora cactorum TaxID=29920 RepID=A0A8T1KTC5_9STRA|nr:hypothetical protein PC113_g9823 [Phytophthora cactorum]KAG2908281.1 hypothetical protein PC114_g10510 [Phytophthora cactorum]KAG4238846.1 hypothetical protein PC116_g13110 [Phytophthora cactorum]